MDFLLVDFIRAKDQRNSGGLLRETCTERPVQRTPQAADVSREPEGR